VPDSASPAGRFIILRQTFVQREEVGKCEDRLDSRMGSAVPHTQQVIKDDSRAVGFGSVECEARQIQLAQGGACGFGLRQAFRRSTRLAAEVD
jgi:hypothetical protein